MTQTGTPSYRPLKIYAFDPTRGRKLNNYTTLKVRCENVRPGPVGDYIAVIDYDASNKKYYAPADLDSPEVLIGGGLDPSESDPRFHQQMVYAVIMETIRRFEAALGRKIRWTRDTGSKSDPYHGKLRVFPHGLQEANAFYDPKMRALVFGYFAAGTKDLTANLPGQTVFTCLSHDIIVHETTHALIDGLREKFTTSTNPDVSAFHEAFADIIALFQHFTYTEALLDVIHRTGGKLYAEELNPDARPPDTNGSADGARIQAEVARQNPLIQLALQFGDAMGMRSGLRCALGTRPDPSLLATVTEPHARGSILVAAVFDAFFSLYLQATRDLMRIARAGGAVAPTGDLHPDLANRLAGEASKIARRVCNICIRALDYCPPVDITFGEFLRAIVTADSDLVPDDPAGYRSAFIEAFRARGIVPEDVASYSEDALRWYAPITAEPIPPCKGLKLEMFGEVTPKQQADNAIAIHTWAAKHRPALGLSHADPFQVHSFHPLHRVAPDGRICFDYVVELLQQREEKLDPHAKESPTFTFWGGSTLILDQYGKIRYSILKRVDNQRRLERERHFHQDYELLSAFAPYLSGGTVERAGFREIHRGV